MQLELPFDKEIESQRDIFRHQTHIIEVTLKDKYNFVKGELVMCTKGDEMIIGYAEVIESDCIMLRHSLIGEKYENTTWLTLKHWSIVKASKFRQSEYENKCKKHGYIIKGFEKVPYKAFADKMCDLSNPFYVASKTIEQSIKICSTVQRIKEYQNKKQELKNTLTQLNETLNKLNKLL